MRFKTIADFLAQNSGSADEHDVLNRKLFDVNMRLYEHNKYYRCLVDHAIRVMLFIVEQDYDDYSDLRGLSGANAGIPWNIVVVKYGTTTKVMLNPKVIGHSPATTKVRSNCGSLRLPQEVEVERWVSIDIEYFTRDGELKREYAVSRSEGGLTMQHEIAHNQGILVNSDRQLEVTPKSTWPNPQDKHTDETAGLSEYLPGLSPQPGMQPIGGVGVHGQDMPPAV